MAHSFQLFQVSLAISCNAVLLLFADFALAIANG